MSRYVGGLQEWDEFEERIIGGIVESDITPVKTCILVFLWAVFCVMLGSRWVFSVESVWFHTASSNADIIKKLDFE